MQVYTMKEAADVLKISLNTVKRYVASGEMPHRRIGRLVRLTDADLEHFMKRMAAPRPRKPGMPRTVQR